MNGGKMELVFATNNNHKLREISNLLGNSFNLLSLKDLDISEDIPEEEPTLEGNALQKARYIYKKLNKNVFADDTGLETEALDGQPGVHSARYAGENKNSDDNINKLLSLLNGNNNRKARFRCVIALIINGDEHLFEGIAEGSIIDERRGSEGFGYDPVFIPSGSKLTFAEMPLPEKNLISHRARAFEKLKIFLLQYNKQTIKK
jgi:XTP/dITP diphosphohydrolase